MENFQDRGVWIRIRIRIRFVLRGWIRIRFVLRGWIRIQFVLRGWIRIRIPSISDRIRNPETQLVTLNIPVLIIIIILDAGVPWLYWIYYRYKIVH